MKIFLAGAGGALGRRLVPRLVAAGHEVVGTSRSAHGAERVRALGATPVVVDALDAAGLREAVASAAPEAVLHQLTDLSAADSAANSRLRREGTRNLVDAARAAGVSRIVAQSISWAYVGGDAPATEAEPLDLDAPAPRGATVAAVAELERICAELPDAVVLRNGLLYGPGTWYAPGGPVAAALRGEAAGPYLASVTPHPGVSSFVHVDDAAAAVVAALAWPAGPVNVVDDEPAPASVWLPALAAALDAPVPTATPAAQAATWERGASNSLARSLGWIPERPTWRIGFADRLPEPLAGNTVHD
ncbi:NAD-dependent epimerase/dehydratase family protein [Streptacidiphilus jiangxiensis]|uniref:Nucleoside-diphosphate-sugar epimerase n=1 Tax=Streptacidiphilus jiangxiensis TaxID=235985 RepID=A0A1H7JNW4_STRJI|nr:NAD(P)-dependent oxidoreductase [Streptacidiphilus jiangxiensis]SEK76272.1 Nucleoside-diphosphate-sugar epimerase [Streptacidiphilus jiangxiensis]